MPTNDAPIACTLAGTDYTERLAWIASLNRDGLLSHARHDGVLELLYAPAVRSRVQALVQKESECCAFLTFTLDESGGDLRLTVAAPDRVRESADLFFEPFLASAAPAPLTGRCAHPASGCCS